jgi:ABC-type branched-subunit amino acid transport system ATPase component
MLIVENISSGYENKKKIFDISFSIGDNEIVLLTGNNGSGKTTVLKTIYGLLPKMNKEAKVIFDSEDITWLITSEMVKKGIVFVPQKNSYFESLTVYENLIVSGSTGLYSNEEIKENIQQAYELPYLRDLRNRTPFNLSGGERQLLALGNALMHKPKLILLDEPFAGLDQINTEVIKNELQRLKLKGIAMLIVEHKRSLHTFVNKELKMNMGRIIEIVHYEND